jgi:capsular exopolysaccharide synthesis family protein
MDKLEKALHKARLQRTAAEPLHPANPGPKSATLHIPRIVSDGDTVIGEAGAETACLDQRRVIAHRTRNQAADIFRLLRTQILQAMGQAEHRSLAITSPNYGDGKTTVAFNLAVSIAQDVKQTVLLVDLDLRKPNIHNFVGLETSCGLTDHLIGDKPLAECLLSPSFERLTILPAGEALHNSSEVLGAPKMAALARELEEQYPDRLIIYDMPPILAQDDSIAFLPHVGAVLVVVRDGVTRAGGLKRSLDLLAGAHVIGTVLNSVRH